MTIVNGLAIPEFLTNKSYGAINSLLNLPMMVAGLAPSLAASIWGLNNDYNLVLLFYFSDFDFRICGFEVMKRKKTEIISL